MVTRFSAEQHHAKDRNSLGLALRVAHLRNRKREGERERNWSLCYVLEMSKSELGH